MANVLRYVPVNEAINSVFFDGRFAGQPVYLSMDNCIRDEIAALLAVDPETVAEAICESVRRTFPNKGNLYEWYLVTAERWRSGGMNGPPPFTALLFTQAYAAEQMEEEGNFASHNYYYRLSKVTGRDREELQAPMRAAEVMWMYLNDWLKANNYALGRPTAYSNRKTSRYVDWPMSQAIVRASDRDRFHDLFERFGFSGSETVTRQEMGHYLANWLPARAQSSRLKRAWEKKELRDRVVEAAIAELSIWSASGKAGSASMQRRTTRLSLVVNIVPRFPRQTLELHLGYQGDQIDPVLISGEEGSFQIANEHFGSIATISPSPFEGNGEALGLRHVFEEKANGRKFDWGPRLVIPFSMPPQGSAWIEASRVGFGTPHMLLVRDARNLPAIVETFLADKVSKLPTRTTHGQLSGLPEGWVLYTNVQLKVADFLPLNEDLECLVPVGAGTVMDFSGGLELLRGIYHPLARPVARLAAPTSPIRLDAVPLGATAATASVSSSETELSLSLSSVDGVHDGIIVHGYLGDELVESEEILMRDADRATPLRRDGKGLLEHSSLMSATPPAGAALRVVGMSVEGELSLQSPTVDAGTHDAILVGEVELSQAVAYSKAVEGRASRKACVHLWPFEMVPENTPSGTPFKSTCSYCKQTLVLIYRRRPTAVAAPKPVIKRFDLPSMPTQECNRGVSADHDILMDALSCLGSGSWGKFESMLEALSREPLYARQVAQHYAMLGHLDFEQRQGSGAIRSWCVPPPTINMVGSDRAFLAGFRSSKLVKVVRERAEIAGGKVVTENGNRGPASIFVDGLGIDKLRDALDGVQDPHARQVTVNEAPALSIAAACLALGRIEESLSPVSIGRVRNLQKFDLTRARWYDVEEVIGGGCYRWNDGFQAYAFVGEDGRAQTGSYQVTKVLAARASGVRLHAYEPETQVFYSSLGCEPSGLLSRALVACSGKLPTIEGGTATYHAVTPAVAGSVLKILYGGKNDISQSK
jgi:hypothetical protein